MAEEYTKEQLWKIFTKLPEVLKETIFSEKTAEDIYNICQRNRISEEKIPEIARLIGNVMLGILLPEKLKNTLKQDLKLKKDTIEKVSFEIERVIFFPIRKELNEIYKIKSATKTKEETSTEGKKDIYREIIE